MRYLCQVCHAWHMLILRFSDCYNIASGDTVLPGTVALRFAAGPVVLVTKGGNTVSFTAVAGELLETGPLEAVTTVPTGTVAMVGR